MLVHDRLNNRMPTGLRESFRFFHRAHNYNTRRSHNYLSIPGVLTVNSGLHGIEYKYITQWNMIGHCSLKNNPNDIKRCEINYNPF